MRVGTVTLSYRNYSVDVVVSGENPVHALYPPTDITGVSGTLGGSDIIRPLWGIDEDVVQVDRYRSGSIDNLGGYRGGDTDTLHD